MSTKAIREALECLKESNPTCMHVGAAEKELDAIEKAAEAWGEATEGSAPKEVHDLMWSILKEKLKR